MIKHSMIITAIFGGSKFFRFYGIFLCGPKLIYMNESLNQVLSGKVHILAYSHTLTEHFPYE